MNHETKPKIKVDRNQPCGDWGVLCSRTLACYAQGPWVPFLVLKPAWPSAPFSSLLSPGLFPLAPSTPSQVPQAGPYLRPPPSTPSGNSGASKQTAAGAHDGLALLLPQPPECVTKPSSILCMACLNTCSQSSCHDTTLRG